MHSSYSVFAFGRLRALALRQLVVLATMLSGSSHMSAQSATTPLDEPEVVLDTLHVIGFRSSLAEGIGAKREAGQVLDLITAEEIGQFGDQNIGEAIQRISGVSLTRNNGEGESISIRGLSPIFTRIEVDGRSTAVTADQSQPGRDSVLSVFASDLYSEIEVVKSTKASDVEGGVGGIVRLRTPDPISIGKLAWSFKASVTDADVRDSREGGFNAFYSNVFADKRVGLSLSVNYNKRDRRLDKVQAGDPDWYAVSTTNAALLSLNGGFAPERLRLEGRAGDNPKLNVNGKFQFMVTPNLELYANTVITREEREEDKSRIQVEFSRGRLQGGTLDPETNTLTAAEFDRQRVDYNNFRRETNLDTTGLSGGAKWRGDLWSGKFEAAFSEGVEDFYEYTVQARINADGIGGYDLGDDPRTPMLYTASTNLPLSSIPLRGLNREHRVIKIDEKEGRLDLRRELNQTGLLSLEVGLRWAETGFHRRQGSQGSPTTKPGGGNITFADGRSPFVLDGTFGLGKGGSDFLTSWPSVDAKDLYEKYPSSEPDEFDNNNLYDIVEENLAAYAQVNFEKDLGSMTAIGNLGVRVVKTTVDGKGRVVLSTATNSYVLDEEPALEGDYHEPLPAFNFTLAPNSSKNVLFRGAVTRALTRPTIPELNPTQSIDAEDQEISRGNPDLDPFLAWQYDFGVEYYFGKSHEGLFAINAFVKDVDNFIVPSNTTETLAFPDQGVPSQTYTVSSYRNGGSASIKGFELNFQTPFTFLPGFLSNFGGAANYTYTDSEFTDAFGFSYTFPGASSDTYNLVIYYEQGGFSGRVAYNYRNDYLIAPANDPDGSNALYGEGGGRLDLSLRYRFKNGVRISVDALNLTEEQSYKYYDIPQRYQNFEFEGTIYSASIAYSF